MKKIAVLISFLTISLASITVKAQSEIKLDVDTPKAKAPSYGGDQVFSKVEHEPEFKGGMAAYYNYLKNNVRYPAKAVEHHTQGKVFVSFIVEKDGSLSDLKVVKGVSEELDAEALRVFKNSPKWIPGMQNGMIVRVFYTVPIGFTLAGD